MGAKPQSAGDTLLQYRIVEKLGQGGMGVVYLAEDTRLGRKVAIKMLPADDTGDAHRRQRLEQEARAAATLSHPAIATVFALEDSPQGAFIVFEYVPGKTLRSQVRPGGLDRDLLLGIALDIASALDAAHAAAIVHRDLKPENVMRMPDGGCKVLDFGLARIDSVLDDAPTRTRLTTAGTVLGTVGYMSPEQLEAREVDFRSDLFSFGTLLYELATGVHPFELGSKASTIAAVLRSDPPALTERNPVHPPELDRIVRKCLRKQREDRYRSTRDLLVDLRNLKRESGEQRATSSASMTADDETSLFRSLRTRIPSARRWWELNLLFALAAMFIMPFGAWWVRSNATGWWQFGARNAVFALTMVTVGIALALRVILLETAVFASGDLATRVRSFAPWLRLLTSIHGILCALAAPQLTIERFPLLVPLLLMTAAVTQAYAFVFEPMVERTAFPAPAKTSSAADRGGAPPKIRIWWYCGNIFDCCIGFPLVGYLVWVGWRTADVSWGTTAFVGAMVGLGFNVASRISLLIFASSGMPDLASYLRRYGLWRRLGMLILGIGMVVLAVPLADGHIGLATALAALAIVGLGGSELVEPAMDRGAFPTSSE